MDIEHAGETLTPSDEIVTVPEHHHTGYATHEHGHPELAGAGELAALRERIEALEARIEEHASHPVVTVDEVLAAIPQPEAPAEETPPERTPEPEAEPEKPPERRHSLHRRFELPRRRKESA